MIRDISGKKFGKLTVNKFIRINKKGNAVWEFICDCGKYHQTNSSYVIQGKTKSCGCLRKEQSRKMLFKHGFYGSRIYIIWGGMIGRCFNPHNFGYKNYGGRGIKVCKRWLDFKKFYTDMFPTYKNGLTIERIDNNRDYSPTNCKWATYTEQMRNKRDNLLFKFQGKTRCIGEWSKIFNIRYITLWQRIFNGNWSIEKALTTPVRSKK